MLGSLDAVPMDKSDSTPLDRLHVTIDAVPLDGLDASMMGEYDAATMDILELIP